MQTGNLELGPTVRAMQYILLDGLVSNLERPISASAGISGEGGGTVGGNEPNVNFDAPAVLRKWPSLRNQSRTEGDGPYLLVDGNLDECIREFMAKPAPARHLYEIHTAPQPPLVSAVLSGEHVVELARLRDFL
jgi:hypothetical protein